MKQTGPELTWFLNCCLGAATSLLMAGCQSQLEPLLLEQGWEDRELMAYDELNAGDLRSATNTFNTALSSCTGNNLVIPRSITLKDLGDCYMVQGKVQAACDSYDRAAQLFEHHSTAAMNGTTDNWVMGVIALDSLFAMSEKHLQQNDQAAANAAYQRARRIFTTLKNGVTSSTLQRYHILLHRQEILTALAAKLGGKLVKHIQTDLALETPETLNAGAPPHSGTPMSAAVKSPGQTAIPSSSAVVNLIQQALDYCDQGHQEQADYLLSKALVAVEEQDTDPSTRVAHLRRIAEIYLDRQQYDKAADVCSKATSEEEQILGKNNISLRATKRLLATALAHSNNQSGAEKEYLAIVRLDELASVPSEELAEDVGHLAYVYDHEAKYPRAIEAYQRAIALRSKGEDNDPATTALLIGLLAKAHGKNGNTTAAATGFRKQINFTPKTPQAESQLYDAQQHLADTLMEQHRYQDALEPLDRLLSLQSKLFGPQSEGVTGTLLKMADAFAHLDRKNDAIRCLNQADNIENRIDVTPANRITFMVTQGRCFQQCNMWTEAESNYNRAIELANRKPAKELGDQRRIIDLMYLICLSYAQHHQPDSAVRLLNDLIKQETSLYGRDSEEVARGQIRMARIHLEFGSKDKALIPFQSGLDKLRSCKTLSQKSSSFLVAHAKLFRRLNEVKLAAEMDSLVKRQNSIIPSQPPGASEQQ